MSDAALYGLVGNLRLSDFPPKHDLIANCAAWVVIFGVVATLSAITVMGWWRALWTQWLTALDHKKIGIMYIVVAFVMQVRAIVEAALMRAQQAAAVNAPGVVSPAHFAELFTTHGTIMIFFMAMPFLTGVINYVMPLQIGARDVAFPWLNAIGLWLTTAGAMLVMASLVIGQFSGGGWSGYPPFTQTGFSPGEGVDYWIWSVGLASLGSTLSGINIAVTIYKKRAPGMDLFCMPLFCWTALCTSILMIFAMPALTVATSLLALDRYAGFHFFTNDLGGNVMNYANLFWLFGHPEVYILILPAFGVYSEVFANFSGKRLYGYNSLVYATMAIAVLSFTVWLHHFFTMGQSADVNAAFGIATMLIAIPTGVKVYDWLLTLLFGRIRFSTAMLFGIAFMVSFVIGGMTGVMLANPPIDFAVHNSLFLVAHFHNMLIPGLLFGMIAAYQMWFPKAFGFRLCERWGKVAFWCWGIGFYLAFMPLYWLGLSGAMRRSAQFFEPQFLPWLIVALMGAVLMVCGTGALGVQLIVSIRSREARRVAIGDPWDGHGLEWATPSPPPEYNFAVIPNVSGRDAFTMMKRAGTAYALPACEDIIVPRSSALPMLIGAAAGVAAFGLVWHIWWQAVAGVVTVWALVIARSFDADTQRTIPAAEVERDTTAWLAGVAAATPAPRSREMTPANAGLAEHQA